MPPGHNTRLDNRYVCMHACTYSAGEEEEEAEEAKEEEEENAQQWSTLKVERLL